MISYYNSDEKKIPNYVRWGAFLTFKKLEDIPCILEGVLTQEEVKTIMNKLNYILNDENVISELEAQRLADWEMKSIYKEAQEKD